MNDILNPNLIDPSDPQILQTPNPVLLTPEPVLINPETYLNPASPSTPVVNSQLPPVLPTQPIPVSNAAQTSTFAAVTTNGKFDINKIIAFLQKYLVDICPISLPETTRDWFVKVFPFLIVLDLLTVIPVILRVIKPLIILIQLSALNRIKLGTYISLANIVGTLIFSVLLIPGLFKKTQKAWMLLFYFVGYSLVFGFLQGNYASAMVVAFCSLYLIFQCRSKYIN